MFPACLRRMGLLAPATALVLAGVVAVPPAAWGVDFVATHKQTGLIDIGKQAKGTHINTFCLDREGNVLAGCGGAKNELVVTPKGREMKTTQHASEIRVYAPDGTLLATWPVDVTPQAISVAPDRTVFVAGGGEMAKLSPDGKQLAKGNTPQLADKTKFMEEAKQEAEANAKRSVQFMEQQFERLKKEEKKILDTEEEKRSKTQTRRLTVLRQQIESMEQQAKEQEKSLEPMIEMIMNMKTKVSAVSATEKEVIVTVMSVKGYGFEVWRCDHDFKNAKKLVSGLSGCCGQMDVQAYGDKIFVAENGKHRVVSYNGSGKEVLAFGKGDRKGQEGFSSCCNPMNLHVNPSGEIITAESETGIIKRFSPEGELLALVGTVSIQGGCKNVGVHATPDAGRVYMLDLTRNRIAMLEKKSDEEFTADKEKEAKKNEADKKRIEEQKKKSATEKTATRTRINSRAATLAPAKSSRVATMRLDRPGDDAKASPSASSDSNPLSRALKALLAKPSASRQVAPAKSEEVPVQTSEEAAGEKK